MLLVWAMLCTKMHLHENAMPHTCPTVSNARRIIEHIIPGIVDDMRHHPLDHQLVICGWPPICGRWSMADRPRSPDPAASSICDPYASSTAPLDIGAAFKQIILYGISKVTFRLGGLN